MSSRTASPSTTGAATGPSSRRLGGAVGVLVGLDALGGAVAVVDGINPPRDAWGARARLAAPWPMIAAQVVLAVLAARARPAVARGAAGALGLACLVSAVSGFVDGGLAAPGLARRHVVLQVVLVAWTAVTGLLAVARAATVTGSDGTGRELDR
jgi:hypothetical protein